MITNMKTEITRFLTLLLIGLSSTTFAQFGQISTVPNAAQVPSCSNTKIYPWRMATVSSPTNQNISICDDFKNIGIGTGNPVSKLHVIGNFTLDGTFNLNGTINNAHFSNGFVTEVVSNNIDAELVSLVRKTSWGGLHNNWSWGMNTSGTLTLNSQKAGKAYLLNPNGAVGIATDCIPSNAKLAVGGKIICEEVEVKLKGQNCWADYVFADDYELKSLSEVESFINKNHHLPGIPSAQTLEEEGLSVKEMMLSLLLPCQQ